MSSFLLRSALALILPALAACAPTGACCSDGPNRLRKRIWARLRIWGRPIPGRAIGGTDMVKGIMAKDIMATDMAKDTAKDTAKDIMATAMARDMATAIIRVLLHRLPATEAARSTPRSASRDRATMTTAPRLAAGSAPPPSALYRDKAAARTSPPRWPADHRAAKTTAPSLAAGSAAARSAFSRSSQCSVSHYSASQDTRPTSRARHSPHGHFTLGGMEERIDSTLPPVLSPRSCRDRKAG